MDMNCLYLSKCIEYFDSCHVYYFNYENYNFFNETEVKKALQENVFYSNDFVQIPQTKPLEVKKKYLESLNDRTLLARFLRMDGETFVREFHNHFEEDRPLRLSHYAEFRRQYLIEFGAKWCDKLGIKYSKK